MLYAVIDTNVLVSALLSSYEDAATVQVVKHLFSGAFIPLYSDQIMAEYREVLSRKKFHFPPEMVSTMLQEIRKHGVFVEAHSAGESLPDPKDLPFYEVVIERQDDSAYLVTGNMKHFPQKPFIVMAREFWGILDSDTCA